MSNDQSETPVYFPTGWVSFGRPHWSRVWNPPTAAATTMVVSQGFVGIFFVWTAFDVTPLVSVPILAGIVALVFWVTTVTQTRRWPLAEVNLDTSELRAGAAIIPLGAVDRATLGLSYGKHARPLTLLLTAGAVRAAVTLRDRHNTTLEQETARVLAEALGRTSIEMPRAKEDPTGRFSRYNYPTNITRVEAIELTLHPPTSTDSLPLPG